MLDISFIRANQDIVTMMSARRGVDAPLKKLLELDDKRRAFSKEEHTGSAYLACVEEWRACMLAVPNIADITAPEETHELARVGEAHTSSRMSSLFYERGPVRVYTEDGTKLIETIAGVRESFFTTRGYVSRVIAHPTEDMSHMMLLERPHPGAMTLALGPEVCTDGTRASSVARLVRTLEGSHTASVEALEVMREEITNLCELLRIPYVLEVVRVRDMPFSACKMYRFSLLVSDAESSRSDYVPRPLATLWYEHDYSARRYGMLYTEYEDGSVAMIEGNGKKKYAHTVHANLDEAHTWLLGVVAGNTANNTCMLPPALHAKIPEGKIVL